MARTIVNPAEQWRALEETASAWRSLRNAAHGRGVEPRAMPNEAAAALQAEIIGQCDRFLACVGRITWADALMPALGSEIGEWRRLYNEVARRWASRTRSTVIQLPELRGLGEGYRPGHRRARGAGARADALARAPASRRPYVRPRPSRQRCPRLRPREPRWRLAQPGRARPEPLNKPSAGSPPHRPPVGKGRPGTETL